jgi:DNA invertase Pin-like site-specific DNA recombinase
MTNCNSPARLIGYVRVSTNEQVESGLSLDAQRERLAAYCTGLDAELVRVEADNGISGKIAPGRRPGLARALAAVRRGDADGIAVLKLDRLGRSTKDLLGLMEGAQRDGWRLISITEALDTRSAIGEFTATILAGLAQMERKLIAERTREAMGQLAKERRVRSGRIPFGFRSAAHPDSVVAIAGDRSQLVEDEAEQRILRQMFRLRAEGLGARRIARSLNATGCVNPRNQRRWTPSTVAKIVATAARRVSREAA